MAVSQHAPSQKQLAAKTPARYGYDAYQPFTLMTLNRRAYRSMEVPHV